MIKLTKPTGTVTFLFTDIEGSTRLVQHLGVAGWRPLLARHRALIREALRAHDGFEDKTEGDGFFAVFRDARNAVRAVTAAQRALAAEPWPPETPIRVRMGLHTGDGVLDPDGDYIGPDVHRAARVGAAGHGGQVVLSGTTVALVERDLDPGVRLRTLGEHRLKDLRPERLWDLIVDGLPSVFPPIRSVDARPNNLPTQLTSFVGRDRELADGGELLLHSRLLTLTGPGGTGKTRLSLQLAANAMDAFPGGIYFVALASINDPSLVLDTIAHTVGIPESPGRRPLDVLADALAGRKLLLVLDNMEQLVAAAPELGDLLRALPDLTIVASSRAVLRVSGEQEYPLAGLPAPPDLERLTPLERERLSEADRRRSPDDVLRYASVRLFRARAQAVRPDFELGTENADIVAAICARLAGMPLAIELAAARVRALPPSAILSRLERQLDLLASGSRDLPERQRTLRGAIAWSHDLLDGACRRLLERLAVFVDGVTLEDAEAVCGPPAELGQDVFDGLGSLVDQSLLRLDATRDEPRYEMLVPIREFALERLEETGEAGTIRDRHAARFLALSESAAPMLIGADQRRWLDRLEHDLGNLRAALDHVIACGDARSAMRFVTALWRFWQIRGHLVYGYARARDVLELPGTDGFPVERVAALGALGSLAWWVADYGSCRRYYEEVLAARRAEGDDLAIARALYDLGFPVVFGQGGNEEARAIFEEARERFRRAGDQDGVARTWWATANTHYTSGNVDDAREALARAIPHFRAASLRFDLAWALYTLGNTELVARRPEVASVHHGAALDLFEAVDDAAGMSMVLDGLAGDAWFHGDLERSARLSGGVARLERASGTGLNASNRAMIGWDPAPLRDSPGTAAAWAEGDAMGLPSLVEYARTGVAKASRADVPPSG